MEIQVIKSKEILNNQVNVYGTNENPLFLAKDVADWIEHSRASEMLKSVDGEEKLMQTILASGQNREMWFLTEDGLYEVFMQSRKPIAKQFKKEVKKILKEVRQTGSYSQSHKTQAEMFAMAGQAMLEMEQKQQEQESRIAQLNSRVENISEIVALNPMDGRKKVTAIINKIALALNGGSSYQDMWRESYRRLELRAKCKLNTRQENKRRKMALEGATQSKIKNVSKIDVIFDCSRLTEIYFAIVKEMAIENQIDVSEMT